MYRISWCWESAIYDEGGHLHMYEIEWKWRGTANEKACVEVQDQLQAAAICELLEILEIPYTMSFFPPARELPF